MTEVIHKHCGFTLLELAIVLVILTLIVGAGMSSMTALRTNLGVSTTRAKQQAIKDALITYLSRNQRLPCPAREALAPDDVAYGVESGAAGACAATGIPSAVSPAVGPIQRGVVPWVSLGLSDADTLDGWYNRFSYFVVETATANPIPAAPLSGMRGGIALHSGTPVGLALPATGNQINACNITLGDNGCNIAAVVLILSYGNNGSSAFMPSGGQLPPPVATALLELANVDIADASFVQTQYSTDEANPFDDLLLPLTPADLLGPLERNRAIQSALSITNERMAAIRDFVVIGIVANNGPVPPTPPPPLGLPTTIPPNDGWGQPITYTRNAANVRTGVPGSQIFTLISIGLDTLPGTPDDIVMEENNVRVCAMINNQSLIPVCP